MLIDIEVLDFLGSHQQHICLPFLLVLISILLLHLFDFILLFLSKSLLLTSLSLLLLLLLFPSFSLSPLLLPFVFLVCLLTINSSLYVLLSIVEECGLFERSTTYGLTHDRETSHTLIEPRNVGLRYSIIRSIVTFPLPWQLAYLNNTQFLIHKFM